MIQFVVAMTATVAVAILFATPKQELLFCGLGGAISWSVYYVIDEKSGNTVAACLAATLVLTIFSRTLAVLRRNPATIYLLSGIFTLVPGAGVYYTVYSLISGDQAGFASKGLETLEVALAIVFGMIFGFAIPETLFHKHTHKKEIPRDNLCDK